MVADVTDAYRLTDGLGLGGCKVGGTAEIHFTGNALSLYTRRDVLEPWVLRGLAPPAVLSGTAPTFRPQTPLVSVRRQGLHRTHCSLGWAVPLGPPRVDHVVSVQNSASETSVYLNLDQAVASRWISAAALSLTTSASALGIALPLASSGTKSLHYHHHAQPARRRDFGHSTRCGERCSCACARAVAGARAFRSSRSARIGSAAATSRFCSRRI
jgi:hypothetical protein